MIKRLIIAIILLGLVVGGLVWFNHFRAGMIAQFMANRVVPPVPVTTQAVTPVTWKPGIDAVGSAIAAQGVDLAVESGGLVREIAFKASDTIETGKMLVHIDDDSERANLAAAEAALNLAEAEAKRARTLNQRGVGATNTLESATAQVESARAQMAQVQTALDAKKMAAPFSGVIGIPRIEVGQYVTPGTTYATLQNLDKMYVDFSLPEQQLTSLQLGRSVSVQTEVGDFSATGTITGIEPQVDSNSRMILVRAEVSNPSGQLLPGQFLRVRIDLPAEDNVIAVPQTAVSSTLYGDSVYVVEPVEGADDLKATQVFVTLGRRSDATIEVIQGLKAGQKIVTSGQNRLSNGVKVVEDNAVALGADGNPPAVTAEPAK